jgi:hypothetical protein
MRIALNAAGNGQLQLTLAGDDLATLMVIANQRSLSVSSVAREILHAACGAAPDAVKFNARQMLTQAHEDAAEDGLPVESLENAPWAGSSE